MKPFNQALWIGRKDLTADVFLFEGKCYAKIAGLWAHAETLRYVGFWMNRRLNKLIAAGNYQ